MREILFRGKKVDNGEWVEGNYFHNFRKVESHSVIPFNSNIWYEVHLESVGQFTGILDKNRKKIFEGDLIKCYEFDPHEQRKVQLFKSSVVGYYQGSFYYFPNGNMKQPHQILMYAYEPEIIGNIHENPELI